MEAGSDQWGKGGGDTAVTHHPPKQARPRREPPSTPEHSQRAPRLLVGVRSAHRRRQDVYTEGQGREGTAVTSDACVRAGGGRPHSLSRVVCGLEALMAGFLFWTALACVYILNEHTPQVVRRCNGTAPANACDGVAAHRPADSNTRTRSGCSHHVDCSPRGSLQGLGQG